MRSNFYIISASSPLNVGQIVSWTLLILSSSVVVLFCHYRSSWQHQQHNYPWVSMYVSLLAKRFFVVVVSQPASQQASHSFVIISLIGLVTFIICHTVTLCTESFPVRQPASQPPQSVHSSVRPPLERHSSPPFPIVSERMLWLLLLLNYFMFLIHIGHVII